MPIMDGIAATMQIRKFEKDNCLQKSIIVALTAAAVDKGRLRDEYQNLGFNELVYKPISRRSFTELVTKYLQNE